MLLALTLFPFAEGASRGLYCEEMPALLMCAAGQLNSRLSALKRRRLIIVLVVLALAVLIWRPWRSRFGYHFGFPLPPTATLVNYHHSWGLDSGDEFVLAVTDDKLRDAIIKEWNLKPSTAVDDSEVMSFAKFTGAPWWPRDPNRQFSERYGRVDQAACNYWSLWVDREHGKLYAEYGNW